jgi:hypothetical protein
MSAEMAWKQLQDNPNMSGTFYRTVLPPPETAVAPAFPAEYTNIPAAGESGDFYTNVWAYRPLAGDGSVNVQTSDFFRVTGAAAMLDELAEQTDYLIHLWGTVQEPSPGLLELELSQWEAVPDAGGLPISFGTIQQEDDQTFLVDEANNATYLLPNAPVELQADDYAAVAGLPETVNGISQITWQKITIYPPPQPEDNLPPTAVPMQALTIESAKLVYMSLPAFATGRADNLFIPAWQFAGTADNKAQVTLWVTAVLPEYISTTTP